jgi:uncharacterized protein DUF1559/SLA1 Homology Domain 1 (SHD1) protein
MPRLRPSHPLLLLAMLTLVAPALAQDESSAPAPGRGEAHLKPVKLPEIKPPTLSEDRVAVKLPSTLESCVVGGGGRYLIFHLKQLRQLAVFDVTQAKVAKYLPLGSDDVGYAAGAEKLVVVLRDQKIVQRWDLAKLEKELTKTIAKPDRLANVVMGSASNGPIFLGGGDFYNNGRVFLDLDTLEDSAIRATEGRWDVGGGADTIVRASANGLVFGMMRIGTSPSGLQDVVITGTRAVALYEHDSVGVITPSPDGQLLYTGGGIYNAQLKKVATNSPGGATPSVHGDFYVLAGNSGLRFRRGEDKNDESISIHLAGETRPLVTLPGLAKELKRADDRSYSRDDWALQRVFYIPDAHLLVLLPPSNDQVVLHRLNLDEALEKSEVDYLFVQSRPPQEAQAGQTWAYKPLVKSKRGSVKIQVASGPEEMKATADGAVTWAVPKDSPAGPMNVILSFSDASGQEVFQTFPLSVQGSAPAPAVTQAGAPAAKTKTGRMKAGAPGANHSPADAAAAAIRAAASAAAQAAKAADAAAQPGQAPPPAGAATAPAGGAAEIALPKIEPTKFEGDEKTIKLPGAASDFIAASGGKLLLAHLKQLRQIAVLDVSRAEIVKYLPVGSDDVLMAAGASKLIVLLRDKNILQRYNLETFERELSVTTPTTDTITSMVMGSASAGPVLMTTGRDDFGGQIRLLDPATMKLIDYKMAGQQQGFFLRGGGPYSRASANGRIFATGETVLAVSDATVTPLGGGFDQRGWGLVPNIDGTILYSPTGMFNSDLKQIGTERPGGIPIPAVQGGYYVLVAGEPFAGIGSGGKLPSVSIHVEGDKRPLLTLSGIFAEVVDRSRTDFNQGMPLDKRLWFIPDAHLLVEVRATLDSLLLHRVDLERLLEKSEVDYLFVASRPPLTAAPGKELSYQLAVRAKRGGVKYELAAGPEGMNLSPSGLVKWTVPADAAGTRHQVIIGVRDALEQEVFHTFTIGVPGTPKPVVTTRAATSPRPSTVTPVVPAELPAGTIPTTSPPSPENLKEMAAQARQEADRQLQQLALEQRHTSRVQPKTPPRTWTDADGNQIEAQLVESFAGMATLRKTDGQTVLAVVAQLSVEDQKFLKELAAAAAEARKKWAGGVTPEAESIARLKTIGIGTHNYHDTYRILPPAYSVDGEGKPLLSWRVHLLPFIGGQKLHALFRFDEPWDSKHNRQLVEFMPAVYQAAGSKAGAGKTNFLAVRGEGAVFPDVVAGQAHGFAAIRDGTSNTIMIVEASDQAAQEWTRPEDWQWSQDDPLKNLVGLRKGGFFALFVDGHVELVSDQNDPETLNRVFGRAEGLPAELKRTR